MNRNTLGTLRRAWPLIAVGLLLLFLLIALGSRGGDSGGSGASPSVNGGTNTGSPESATSSTTRRSTDPGGLPTIAAADLPPEGRKTLALIAKGGPYPYSRDGSVFSNREKLLPIQPRGYYREYTVRTPGENDRGARRIVAGRDGPLYYTADHYESFARIEP